MIGSGGETSGGAVAVVAEEVEMVVVVALDCQLRPGAGDGTSGGGLLCRLHTYIVPTSLPFSRIY